MAERQMQLEDWLDDLCVRFIINLPEDNLSSVERICFQVEEAQWFYEDFIRPLDPNLPSLSLRNFCLRIFTHCPLLSVFAVESHMQAFEEFLTYKKRIPVRGAILLNEAMDATVLVKGWKKGANWSFPRGKINKDEDDLICAIREVYEETGFDLEAAGLVPADRNVKHIEVNMREQQMRLYVFKNVPMDTYFEPRTRKEISKIQWWRLSELPAFKKKSQNINPEVSINANKFYMVAPFLVPLRKWVIEQKKANSQRTISNSYIPGGLSHDEFMTEEDRGEESATQAPYEVSAPESSTLEEATKTLSRLLKIQPPTQGLQPEVVSAGPDAQAKSSGQALLALLQSKPATSQLPPETPFDQIIAEAPIPATPHHPHPHPPRFSELPQAPQYHIQESSHTYSHENSFPQQYSHPQYPQHPRSSHSHPPIPQQRHPNHYQPQNLVHPQPLPPHVQKAVFTGGARHSPLQAQQPLPQWAQGALPVAALPQIPAPHNSTVPLPPVHPIPLSGHSMALLNAFKAGPSHGAAGSNTLPTAHVGTQGLHPHPQELPAELAQPTPTAPRHIAPSITQLIPNPPSFRAPLNDAHRSNLLDMFKSPVASSSKPSGGLAATALPTSNTPSAVELSAVEPVAVVQSSEQQTGEPISSNGRIPKLNPEANLPYRAVSILTRPAEKSDGENRSRTILHSTPRDSPGAKHAGGTNDIKSRAANQPKPFQPQILKRPQPGLPNEALPTALPLPNVPSSAPVSAPVSVPDGQGNVPPKEPVLVDHKQRLLSLFGKTSPAPLLAQLSSLDASTTVSPLDPSVRSRVGSIVSPEANSRRGSQTPLSKANESFLLGYLDAVTSGGHH